MHNSKILLLAYNDDPIITIQPDKKDHDLILPDKCIAVFFKNIDDIIPALPNVCKIGRFP